MRTFFRSESRAADEDDEGGGDDQGRHVLRGEGLRELAGAHAGASEGAAAVAGEGAREVGARLGRHDVDLGGGALVGHELGVAKHAARQHGQLLHVFTASALGLRFYAGLGAAMDGGTAVKGALAELGAVRLDDERPGGVGHAGLPGRDGRRGPAGVREGELRQAGGGGRAVQRSSRRHGRRRLAVEEQGRGQRAQGILHDEDADVAGVEVDISAAVEGVRSRRRRQGGRGRGG